MPKHDKTVLFLFGEGLSPVAGLEATVLGDALAWEGTSAQWAALSSRAASQLRARLDKPVRVVRPGLSWLGGLGRSRLPVAPAAVFAWDVQAACQAPGIVGKDVPVCAIFCNPRSYADLSAGSRFASATCVICHSESASSDLARMGIAPERIRVLPPAVDPAMLQAAQARRPEIRRDLGLSPDDAPVFTVPYRQPRDQGHFRAGWATLLLRAGGLSGAKLLLPEPGREASRIVRFAASSNLQSAIAIAPPSTPWLDLLAASDCLVVPDRNLFDPAAVAWAMAAQLPIVTAGIGIAPPLLDETTQLPSLTVQPLNLARAMLSASKKDRVVLDLIAAAHQREFQLCPPANLARACLAACQLAGPAAHS